MSVTWEEIGHWYPNQIPTEEGDAVVRAVFNILAPIRGTEENPLPRARTPLFPSTPDDVWAVAEKVARGMLKEPEALSSKALEDVLASSPWTSGKPHKNHYPTRAQLVGEALAILEHEKLYKPTTCYGTRLARLVLETARVTCGEIDDHHVENMCIQSKGHALPHKDDHGNTW